MEAKSNNYHAPLTSILNLPIVQNQISETVLSTIPTDVYGRRDFIRFHLGQIQGCVFSKSLNEWVAIAPRSIAEISSHASKSTLSTIMALNCVHLVENAILAEDKIPPHSNRERKDFNFKEMKVLVAKLENIGTAKITVGKQSMGKHFVYCITAIEIEKRPL